MIKNNYIKLSFAVFVLVLCTQCTKTNWYENYREKEKSPFGTYIIFNEAKDLFNSNEIIYLKDNIHDYLVDDYESPQENFANYICIKSHAGKLNDYGIESILKLVYDGNDAFLSLNYFSEDLKEKLQFQTNNLDDQVFGPVNLKELKGELTLKNEKFNDQRFNYDRNLRRHYFTTFNKDKSIVLGTQSIDNEDVPMFIKIYHGKGAIYLHTQPIVFTNYFLLTENYTYAANILSYLPDRNILWDSQIRSSNYAPYDSDQKKESIFKFFLENPSLKWSLYLFFFGLLLFMVFNARRKQRPIPIISSLKNSTVEFTHTIANLYLKENNHKNLVDKKIAYFLERIRRTYLLNTSNLDKKFVRVLASKSGNSFDSTNYLINTINALHKKSECTQHELYRLNKLTENFFQAN